MKQTGNRHSEQELAMVGNPHYRRVELVDYTFTRACESNTKRDHQNETVVEQTPTFE